MKNLKIMEIFEQMADIMEILGDDRFRINSYRKISRIIGDLPTDIEILLQTGQLGDIPGIGKSSIAKIEEFIKTGKVSAHQELMKKIPANLLDLLAIPGMGPKGVKAVYDKLNVTNISDLTEAIESGKLAELEGFGEKKAQALKRGIEFVLKSTGRARLDQALQAAYLVISHLENLKQVDKIQIAGSLRRRAETIGDVDILVTTTKTKDSANASKIIQTFVSAPFVREVLAGGDTKGSAIIETEITKIQVDIRVVPNESFGAAAQYFTGSKQHNVRLREIAVKKKLKLNEYGLYKKDKMIAGADEHQIYEKLGLDYVDPLLREDRGEIQSAKEHSLPDIVTIKDIKGDFHMHTVASDGKATIEEMAQAAKELGYKYICITDHSKSSAIANGLSANQLISQIQKVRKLNEKIKDFSILIGSEVDILADGSLDFENEILAELDFVIASIHSGMAGPTEKVTTRTLKAMDNPYVHCIGHPSGRLIGQREAMKIDIAKIIEQAAQTNTSLEINANPYRLDLKDTHCRMAVESGVMLCIGTDAHSPAGLGIIEFGVATAARGWATKANILNTLTIAKLKKWLQTKRPN
jgi:DNA polymerase (family 10)